jgi:hypothetical protein
MTCLLLLLGAYHGCDDPGFPEHQSAVLKQNKKDKSYTMIFIITNALHVSGGSSAHHQELKTVYTTSQLTHDSGKKQKKLDKYPMLCIQF